ncbi:hypothetical protein ABZ851_15090 [Streptomyces sp. NPDC047049]|uniref:hypothetical protein n=1 Tax=Streptomyces sp. NPDC047049 TaxID=3156688 RepID=UPI0033F58AC7
MNPTTAHAPQPAPSPAPVPARVPAPVPVPYKHRRAVRSPRWEQVATAYEHRLGAALERDPAVRRIAQLAVRRLYDVLGRDFTPQRAAGAFYTDDRPGQPRPGRPGGDLPTRLQASLVPGSEATVRQLMTSFYNAAYYRHGPQAKPPGGERAVSFKTLLRRHRPRRPPGPGHLRLRRYRDYRRTCRTWSALRRLPRLPPPHLFADDVFALGNLPARRAAADRIQDRRAELSDRLRKEGQLHADLAAEALSVLPPVKDTVFHAGWEPFYQGARITFTPFTAPAGWRRRRRISCRSSTHRPAAASSIT